VLSQLISSAGATKDASDKTNDDATTTPTATAAASADTGQPPAAVIALGSLEPAPTPAAGVAAGPATIGDTTKGRAKSATTGATENPAPTSDAAETADSEQAPSQTAAADTAEASRREGSVTSQSATSAASAQQAPASQAAASTADLSRAAANNDTGGDRFTVRAADPSMSAAAGTAGNSSTTTAAKTDVAGLPNFGFSAAVAASNTQTSGASGTTSTSPTVSIAGLAVAIATRAQSGSNQFDIRLDPQELGRIDVQLTVDSSGQVTTHVTAERADTLQLLQSQQPQIENALQQAGLKTADNGLQFTLRDQSFSGQNNNGSGSQPNNTTQIVIPDAEVTPVAATQIYARGGRGGGVDIRV
jgi:flagellar hook-length control protein FliK